MLGDVNGACNARNWMHGEDSRPAARPPSLLAIEDKNQRLRADVQQRVIQAALRWVGEHEALAKLLKGRTGHSAWFHPTSAPARTRG